MTQTDMGRRRPDRDVALLFATRGLRMFGYGFLAVVLILYLSALGFSGPELGLLLALTLLGDAVISLWLTTHADGIGRRRVLIGGAGLMLAAGLTFVATPIYVVLVIAATVGVISPSGSEIGPFLAVEQAALSQLVGPRRRTGLFAWYQLAGSFATAAGAAVAGIVSQVAIGAGASPADAYRLVIVGYALVGIALAVLFSWTSPHIEAQHEEAPGAGIQLWLGLHRSRGVVVRLASLFALDAFGSGLTIQSFVVFWFHQRFGLEPATLGALLFGANLLAGISALAAGWLAARFGLLRTMVFSHLPSNVLLAAVPFMPTAPLAVVVVLVRYSISQMDVPARQSYVMGSVAQDERSAAAGVTAVARSVGASAAALVAGPLFLSATLSGAPFVIGGALKVIYDVLLYRGFRRAQRGEDE